jgi:hypothetical protein
MAGPKVIREPQEIQDKPIHDFTAAKTLTPALSHPMGEGDASYHDGLFHDGGCIERAQETWHRVSSCNRNRKLCTLAHRMGEGWGEGNLTHLTRSVNKARRAL